jgi:hypothetical protein
MKIDRSWFTRILDFINPLRDPSLTVAAVLTFIEEAGQHDAWYWVIVFGLVNWLAVRGIVWLIVNFTFASTFISRRLWWAIRHPRLAWRILDAVGHEEIVIGGLPTIGEGVVLPDGTTIMSPVLGASGIHVIGELPAGTEVPMLGMPDGTMVPDLSALASSGIFGNTGALPGMGTTGMYPGSSQADAGMGFPQMGSSDFTSQPTTDNFPKAFPQRPSAEEERLRQQVAAYARLLDDWIQFTEEKWRTVSDSQLGWKPLRGRWGSWDDIFADAYAAKTSDPMAQAAQDAGDATARRFENAKEKGSAASAVACFLRDMMTLRRGLDMMQRQLEQVEASPSDPSLQQTGSFPSARSSGPLRGTANGGFGGNSLRGPLIRRPSQIFVDADTQK